MFVRHEAEVEVPMSEVQRRIELLRSDLDSMADVAYRDGEELRARVGALRIGQGGRMSIARAAFRALLLVALLGSAAHAATLPAGFSETRIATGLANPTAMAFAPVPDTVVMFDAGAFMARAQLCSVKSTIVKPSVTVTPVGE